MKLFKQVFKDAAGYFFRLTLPVAQFTSAERYETAEDAALRCDLFKLYLVGKYQLKRSPVFPSLPPSRLSVLLSEAGIDASPSCLFDALPQSCRDFLLDGGTEALEAHVANRAAMHRVIS